MRRGHRPFARWCFTFNCDSGLAELAAGLVGGLAQVVAGIVPGGGADLQTGRPVREADPGAAGRCQVLPVLHPLDLERGGATNVTPEAQLVTLVHRHWLERDVEHRSLLGLCGRDGDSLVCRQTVLRSVLKTVMKSYVNTHFLPNRNHFISDLLKVKNCAKTLCFVSRTHTDDSCMTLVSTCLMLNNHPYFSEEMLTLTLPW